MIDHTYRSHAHQKDEDQDHRPPAGQPHLSQSGHFDLSRFPHPNTLSIASKYNRRSEPRNAFHTVRGLECGDQRQKHPQKHTHTYRQKQFAQSAAPDRILTGECFEQWPLIMTLFQRPSSRKAELCALTCWLLTCHESPVMQAKITHTRPVKPIWLSFGLISHPQHNHADTTG